jgi:hypothetical protein
MSLGSSDREAGENFDLVDCQDGCSIYQEPSGQLLVAVDQRPQEYWLTDTLPAAQALCRRLRALG